MDVAGPSDELKASSSGLGFKLHPLVLINMSDHWTRMHANPVAGQAGDIVVLGCLLGSQTGRTVDISNSFEIKWAEGPDGSVDIDTPFLLKKQEQYKAVFPKVDLVGWYVTGAQLEPRHMAVHRKMSELQEAPVLLMLDAKISPARKELPVQLYESELQLQEGGAPQIVFVTASYSVETSDAERIGVDQVAKILPGGKASGSEQLTAHLAGLHSAIKMLTSKLQLLAALLAAVQAGQVEHPHALLRQVSALLASLPALDTPAFQHDYLKEHNDTLAAVYLSTMTKGVAAANEIVDKVGLAFEKGGRSGGRGGGRSGMGGFLDRIDR